LCYGCVMADLKSVFLNEKPVSVLTSTYRKPEPPFIGEVAKSIDTTYAHTVKITDKLEQKGFIERELDGRKKYIHLTDKGERYAQVFVKIVDLSEEGVQGSSVDLTSGSPIAD